MVLVLAYLAGLLTLINPCVLPVLPIVLASSLQAERRAPLALALGMSVSFVALGLGLAALGPGLGITDATVNRLAALLMAGFGAVMLVPALNGRFAGMTAGLAARADRGMAMTAGGGLAGQALGGALLGAVWSPCIGPTLGAALGLAAQGHGLGQALATMLAFALGVSTLILALAYGARRTISRVMPGLRGAAHRAKPVLGAVFLAVGLGLLFHLNRPVEAWLLGLMPSWLADMSVAI